MSRSVINHCLDLYDVADIDAVWDYLEYLIITGQIDTDEAWKLADYCEGKTKLYAY